MRFGDYDQAAAAAEASLNLYADLVANGRIDLREEQARLRAALGQVLYWRGDLQGAISAWQEAGPVLAQTGRENAALAAEGLCRQVSELQDLLSATPAAVPAHVNALRENFEEATRMSREGQVETGSFLLASSLATGLALRRIDATDALLELCGEIGIAVGVTGGYSGRHAAAVRGLGTAAECYVTLYNRHQRPEHLDRWCDTQIGVASLLLIRGDQAGADSVLQDAEASLAEVDPQALLPGWRACGTQWTRWARLSDVQRRAHPETANVCKKPTAGGAGD